MTRPGLSGPLTDIDGIVGEVQGRVSALVEARAGAILAEAEARWPVRTGRSRDGLYLQDVSSGPLQVYRIGNKVEYAKFIESSKIKKKKGATDLRWVLTEELGRPVREARREIVDEARRAVADAIESATR